MSKKSFLLIHGGIYAVFAFALFFLANQMWPIYGMEINDEYAKFLSQHNSIFLGGIALISFLFAPLVNEDERAAKKIFLGLLGTNLLGFIITLYACLIGVFSGFGWSDPAFFAFLSVVCYGFWKK